MPVALITIHAYRSWTEDNPRGYVQRGTPGVQRPNERLATHRAMIAKHPRVLFEAGQRALLIKAAAEVCASLTWRLHAAAVTPTHIHLLVSWKQRDTLVREISTLLKRKLGNRLSRRKGSRGNRWFSRGVDETPVRDRRHFDHLCGQYLPQHVEQNGVFWREQTHLSTA
jgi:REP element-mobilizing transposase RayT